MPATRTSLSHRVSAGARKGDLAQIHIASAALRLSDDEYRDLMSTVCAGVRSAALLDHTGRKRFLAHLQACLRASRGAPAPATERVVRGELSAPQKRMWSLWMQLVDAGLAQHRTMAALSAFAQRQTQVEQLAWLSLAQEQLVIESLKRWLRRGGEA